MHMHMERFSKEKGSVLIIDANGGSTYNTPDNLEERFTYWHHAILNNVKINIETINIK